MQDVKLKSPVFVQKCKERQGVTGLKRNTGLFVSSLIMILLAVPMALWCAKGLYVSDSYYDPAYGGPLNPYQTIGALLAALSYLWSIITGFLGIVFTGRAITRLLVLSACLQLLLAAVAGFCLREMFFITMLPLVFITLLYLVFTAGRIKRDCSEDRYP